MNNNPKVEKMENHRKEYLRNMNLTDLQKYIGKLINNYYSSYICNDRNKLNNAINDINSFLDEFKSTFPNIHNYINYIMLLYSNQVIKGIFKNDEMFEPESVELIENGGNISLFNEDLIKEIIEDEFYYCRQYCKYYTGNDWGNNG